MKENKQLFDTLKAGLGNGLKFTVDGSPVNDLQGVSTDVEEVYGNDGDGYLIALAKPHLFPLSMLTEPIIVSGYNDGKEFFVINQLSIASQEHCTDQQQVDVYDLFISVVNGNEPACRLQSYLTDILDELHVNWRGLKPEQFINAKESKVYETTKQSES